MKCFRLRTGLKQRRNPFDMFLRNYVDKFPHTNGEADIKMDVSTHVETVVLMSEVKE